MTTYAALIGGGWTAGSWMHDDIRLYAVDCFEPVDVEAERVRRLLYRAHAV